MTEIPLQFSEKEFNTDVMIKLDKKDQDYLVKQYKKVGQRYRLKRQIFKLKRSEINRIRIILKKVGIEQIKFIGLSNFIEILTKDERFRQVIGFTFFFTLFNVVFLNILGLGIALIVDSKIRWKNLYRGMFFLPHILSLIIVAYVWRFIFRNGFVTIYQITNIELFDMGWLSNVSLAPISIIITSVWHGLGYIMVIYLAGLQTIPKSLLEASFIDGANSFQRFRNIILPLLMPSITISFFLTLVNSLKTFEIMLGLTSGGPGAATTSIVLDIYYDAFRGNRFAYATAKAIILLVIIMIITMIQLSVMKKREVEY
jgi:raffinose/stachyose/melibiose transport system permease protein